MPTPLSAIRTAIRRARAQAADNLAELFAYSQIALDALPANTTSPVLWVYAPNMPNNPFQSMLYSHMAAKGIATLPCADLRSARVMRHLLPSTVTVVAHQHWTHQVLHHATARGAAKAVDEFIIGVRSLQHSGIPVMWTIHNALPHDARFVDDEMRLQHELSLIADKVHVMSPRTSELCAPWFATPGDKVMSIPHPSYDGVYPDSITRNMARAQLGIAEDEVVFVMFGAIKGYKGINDALSAIDALALSRKVRLIVAGRADAQPATRQVVDEVRSRSYALLRPELIPADEVQIYMRAADIALLPYRRTLNSGALALSLTFSLPVVMPNDSGSTPLLDPTFSETYDPSETTALTQAVERSLRLVCPEARAAARAAANRIRLDVVAEQFATQARTWVDSLDRNAAAGNAASQDIATEVQP